MPLPALPMPGGGDFRVRQPSEVATRIAQFVSPLTRILLSGEGLTTTLLQALLGEPVQVTCVEHQRVPASAAPVGAARLLGPGDGELLVRCSVLEVDGVPLSLNHVVARLDLAPQAEPCLADSTRPLGEALHAVNTGYRRTVLDVGCRAWPGATTLSAAFKTYLLWHGNEPLMAINELFNPGVVQATVAVPRPVTAGKRS